MCLVLYCRNQKALYSLSCWYGRSPLKPRRKIAWICGKNLQSLESNQINKKTVLNCYSPTELLWGYSVAMDSVELCAYYLEDVLCGVSGKEKHYSYVSCYTHKTEWNTRRCIQRHSEKRLERIFSFILYLFGGKISNAYVWQTKSVHVTNKLWRR